jgi:hypothetical protein
MVMAAILVQAAKIARLAAGSTLQQPEKATNHRFCAPLPVFSEKFSSNTSGGLLFAVACRLEKGFRRFRLFFSACLIT